MPHAPLALAALLAGPVAIAGTAYDATLDVTKDNTHLIAGSGISGQRYAINTNDTTGESASIKVRERDNSGSVKNLYSGNRYVVLPGSAVNTPNRPWWTIDFQVSPGESGTVTDITLQLDFDPAVGVESFGSVTGPVSGFWDAGDGYFTTNTGGGPVPNTWSNQNVPFVVSNSWNLDFFDADSGFPVAAAFYDRDATGEYKFILTAYNGATKVAEVEAFAMVVPAPAAGVAGLGLLGLLGTRRR